MSWSAPTALNAYEAAAGVRIVPGALATQDVDLLWDARKRVQFVIDLGKDAGSMLAVLMRADPSFRRKSDEGQNESAINDKGFEVDFIRRETEQDDPHPFRFSADEEDLWPVRAKRASVLTRSPVFVHRLFLQPARWRPCARLTRKRLWRSSVGWQRMRKIASQSNVGATCFRRRLFKRCWTQGW